MIPRVSVIVAAYNVARYIERAVASALAQEGVEVEVIAVDDVSSDATWDVLEKISDPRLKRIRMERNGGPGAARNAGIAAAMGEWIAVLDGDDAFEPGRLARCVARARETGADIVADNITVLRETDGSTFTMFPPAAFARRGTIDLAGFIAGNRAFLGGHTLGYLKPVFSAAFLKRHGLSYETDIRIGEDYILFASALARGGVCAVEGEAGYVYTARAGSISHRITLADLDRIAACDERFLSRHVLNPQAARAQGQRARSLREARAFTLLVSAIKGRDAAGAVRALCHAPRAVRHLWRPVRARLFGKGGA